jgi:hypothetical protein
MSYINNGALPDSLLINEIDYTDRLVSWEATDSNPIETGMVITTGSIVLAAKAGETGSNYRRDSFKRGQTCILTVQKLDGSIVRHPRGLLYVMGSVYDASTGQTIIETGCELALTSLTDKYEYLLENVPWPLDPERSNLQSVGAGYLSAGRFLYMDNQGDLVDRLFFENDTETTTDSGSWVSVLGYTTVEVAPLTGAAPVPDVINLNYQEPLNDQAIEEPVKVDTSQEDSTYYITYPATVYVRVAKTEGIPDDSRPSSSIGSITGRPSSCGGTAPPTDYEQGESGVNEGNLPVSNCSSNYSTQEQEVIVPGNRTQSQQSYYEGVGGQISLSESVTYVTSVDINSNYYADRYAYCRFTYGNDCDPGGGCPFFGSDTMSTENKTITNYLYDTDGSLKTQIVNDYRNLLSAARAADWRSGVVDGIPQGFREFPDTYMYLASRSITDYSVEGNLSVEKTVRYESSASEGEGLGYKAGDSFDKIVSNVDALNGRVFFTTRKSSSTSVDPSKPDTVAKISTAVKDLKSVIPVFEGRYTGPSVSGPYSIDLAIPAPLLQPTQEERDEALSVYSVYALRSTKGDSLGLSITEMLRDEIIDTWTPNAAFRFADTESGEIIALRMNATSWTVGSGVCAFSTNGLWMGISNGTVSLPSNLVGNATPVFPPPNQPVGAPLSSPDLVSPPSIENESNVDQGSVGYEVNVYWTWQVDATPVGNDGVVQSLEANEVLSSYNTVVCYCSGSIVQSGDLVSTVFNGSVPISYAGSLMTEDATIIIADLFA